MTSVLLVGAGGDDDDFGVGAGVPDSIPSLAAVTGVAKGPAASGTGVAGESSIFSLAVVLGRGEDFGVAVAANDSGVSLVGATGIIGGCEDSGVCASTN